MAKVWDLPDKGLRHPSTSKNKICGRWRDPKSFPFCLLFLSYIANVFIACFRGNQGSDKQGLGIERPSELQEDDDEFAAYRKRMMLAYRFRPNPLVSWTCFLFYRSCLFSSPFQIKLTANYVPLVFRTTRGEHTTSEVTICRVTHPHQTPSFSFVRVSIILKIHTISYLWIC
jgi:hypothetical protein